MERFGGGLGVCVGLTNLEGFLRTLGVWGLAWGLGGLDQLRRGLGWFACVPEGWMKFNLLLFLSRRVQEGSVGGLGQEGLRGAWDLCGLKQKGLGGLGSVGLEGWVH